MDKRVQNPEYNNQYITLLHYQPVAQDTSVVDLFSGRQSVADGFRAALKYTRLNHDEPNPFDHNFVV